MLILDNGILRVSITEPDRVYGSRFAHSGFISSVIYMGKEYMGSEKRDTMGAGLCNEFSIHSPIDYNDKKPGEAFSKIGVGKLIKEEYREYEFKRRYELVPDAIDIIPGENSFTFVHHSVDVDGMSYAYETRIALSDTKILIGSKLTNTGTKLIDTDEYRHNFINMGGGDIDENYSIELSGKPTFTIYADNAVADDGKLRFTKKSNEPFHIGVSSLPEATEQFASAVSNHREGMYILERCFFTPSFVNIWGRDDVISVEIFKKLYLEPGETESWNREYVFQ